MCGIVAVMTAPEPPRAPDLQSLACSLEALRIPAPTGQDAGERALRHAVSTLATTNWLLTSPRAEQQLLAEPRLLPRLRSACSRLDNDLEAAEQRLDAIAGAMDSTVLERVQGLLVRVADGLWALRHDRLSRIEAIAVFLGTVTDDPAIAPISSVCGYSAVETALRGIDRLEVRGRDSAGVHVWVHGPGMVRLARSAQQEITERHDPLLSSGAVEVTSGGLAFTYKTAALIGHLGENVATLRAAIIGDRLLAKALSKPGSRVSVLAHTRWASVGRISEANAHPLHQAIPHTVATKRPYTVAVLNGDIDNHESLRISEGISSGQEITTDAKLIPVLVSRKAESRDDLVTAFADTTAGFVGSFAIAAQSEHDPDSLLLSVRGSGQSLYVGFALGAWVVASEPYGLVGETDRYLRIDGTVGSDSALPGTVVSLCREGAGEPRGLTRFGLRGEPFPVAEAEIARTEITTRDIDRGEFGHFLLKELAQAPESVAKTLRGRIVVDENERRRVRLGERSLPESAVAALRSGRIGRLVFIGQGTAAVACDGIAATARSLIDGSLSVMAMPATEFSAEQLTPDMRDCLLVAVSQSGTTTDTNRAVALARERGATVVSIVNRRDSDLVTKSDGVLYTSDGRDIEMAVASTKAFYAQIAAGILLLLEIRGLFRSQGQDADADQLLAALEDLPEHIAKLVNSRNQFQSAARSLATRTRHWAVVGSGLNHVAAAEVRIKLSELCYRSVAVDTAEDKKHIDLSAEAMIVVCAAGVDGALADDLDKEVGIFAAHNNVPVVIASEGQARFQDIDHILTVPETHPALSWLLSVVAGHLFAYECAAAIDDATRPLRQALKRIKEIGNTPAAVIGDVRRPLRDFLEQVAEGVVDGCLPPRHALRLTRLSSAINAHTSHDESNAWLKAMLTGGADCLEQTLTAIIGHMTRPIDTVKHQAKTITVGTSRNNLGISTSNCPNPQAERERSA